VNTIKNLAAESEDERGLALLMAVVFDDQFGIWNQRQQKNQFLR
jgi:hypothetical protein